MIDDPHRRRGLRSKPFDGEGVANAGRAFIDKGVLTCWLLDCASARQLGLNTTGHAARGTGGPPMPSATNLYMEAGMVSPAALIADIKQGFYVTELMGMGVNGVTGDYSRGAAGFWIENGEIAFPVSEVTIAGNLKDMFLHLTPANDLEFRYGTNAPTCRIEGMTIAGSLTSELSLLEDLRARGRQDRAATFSAAITNAGARRAAAPSPKPIWRSTLSSRRLLPGPARLWLAVGGKPGRSGAAGKRRVLSWWTLSTARSPS